MIEITALWPASLDENLVRAGSNLFMGRGGAFVSYMSCHIRSSAGFIACVVSLFLERGCKHPADTKFILAMDFNDHASCGRIKQWGKDLKKKLNETFETLIRRQLLL